MELERTTNDLSLDHFILPQAVSDNTFIFHFILVPESHHKPIVFVPDPLITPIT